MSEPGEGSNGIKVVDRRHFDESGELRPDRPVLETKPALEPSEQKVEPVPAAPVEQPAAGPAQPTPASGGTATTSPLFLDLIAGLAQQAEMLMTGAQGLPAQPAEAQRVIEYLSMLESKTTGNVSTEEQQVLSNVIFQLRALYVQQQNT